MARKVVGILMITSGAYLVVTCQAWGLRLIDWIGPERALGAANVHREPDGSIFMTNPAAMLEWSLPFLIFGIAVIVLGVLIVRRPRLMDNKSTPSVN
jgi:hypothetical protein